MASMTPLITLLAACSLDEPSIDLTPRPAASTADLLVTPVPPEGEQWTYTWRQDGRVQRDLVERRVPAARTQRGQRWSVQVVRRVGRRASGPAKASVVIDNGAPTLRVAITETSLGLEAVWWADDPDGDTVEVEWAWEQDGKIQQVGGLVSLERLVRDEVWTLKGLAFDGERFSLEAEATYSVGNQAPQLRAATIEPANPTAADALSIAFDGEDPDGDAIEADVTWRADGQPFATGTPLSPGEAPSGVWIDAVVTLTDGTRVSTPMVTPGVRLENGVPSITDVRVEPSELSFGVGPTCVVDGWADPEGEPEQIVVRWFIDSVLWSGYGSISGTELVKGQQVQCEATPVDSLSAGTPLLSEPVSVQNSPPSVARVFLEPHDAVTGDEVQVTFETVYDPDSDPVLLDVQWLVDGVEVARTEVGDPLTPDADRFPGDLLRGDVLDVVATPFDGTDMGIAVYDSLEVGNAPPTIIDLTLSPDPPLSDQPLTAIATTSDADGDLVELLLDWSIDGAPPVRAAVVPSSELPAGATVDLTATPSDGTDNGAPRVLQTRIVQ